MLVAFILILFQDVHSNMLNFKEFEVLKLVATIILISMMGCSSVPVNYGKPPIGSKIGIMLLIEESPSYQHIGTTTFNNEDLSYISTTDYSSKFYSEISNLLIRATHHPILLKTDPSLDKNANSLFGYIDFKDSHKATLNKIASNNDLDFIIVVYPPSGPAWPNSSAYLSGYGLYSRCAFNSCSAYALNYVSARIYDVKNKTSLKPMDFAFFAQELLTEINIPKDLKSIKSSDIDYAADKALIDFMDKFTKMIRESEFL